MIRLTRRSLCGLILALVAAGLTLPYLLALRMGRHALRLDVLMASLRRGGGTGD